MLCSHWKSCANNASIQCPDSDNDGILGLDRHMSFTARDKNGITDEDGCPEGRPIGQMYTESIVNIILNDVQSEPLEEPVLEPEVVNPLQNNTDETEVTNSELT